MFLRIAVVAIGSLLAGNAGSAAAPHQANGKGSLAKMVRLPQTSLLVSLPADWEISPAKSAGLATTALHYKGSPAFEVTAMQNNSMPHSEASVSLPFECDHFFGAMAAAVKTLHLAQRPNFIPKDYYSRVLVESPTDGQVMSTCLYLGTSVVALMVHPAPNDGNGSQLYLLFESIARAGKQVSTLLYAPGLLKLPVMRVTASMSSGIWAAGTTSLPGSSEKRDLLVRVSGPSELKFVPTVGPGICSLGLMPNHKRAPPYVSPKWEQSSWETTAPNGQLLLTACRQIAPAKILLVNMQYEAPAVPASDTAGIATALDEIAEAVISGQH